MNIRFKIVKNDIRRDTELVEIWIGERMVGAIYPREPNGVRLITNHPARLPTIGAGRLPLTIEQEFDVSFPVRS